MMGEDDNDEIGSFKATSIEPMRVTALRHGSHRGLLTHPHQRQQGVAIRWVPAYSGAAGNEMADRYAKSAATGDDPVEGLPEGYAAETSLSHMTEARPRETAGWVSEHVRPERRYRPPPGRGLRRTQLRR